jgi:Holliday junction resolvase RusA-like endonuclease
MRSEKYLLWISQADQLFMTQKRTLLQHILYGDFHCLLELVRPDKRRRDGDNYFKAPLDYATRVGLITDDSHCQRGTFAWVSGDASVKPTYGCRLTMWEAE